jgi:hypothetical protein
MTTPQRNKWLRVQELALAKDTPAHLYGETLSEIYDIARGALIDLDGIDNARDTWGDDLDAPARPRCHAIRAVAQRIKEANKND